MRTRMLPILLLPLILPGGFALPADAGEEAVSIPLCSNGKGDAGWIEVDRTDGRMQATPHLRISGESLQRAAETAELAAQARVSAEGERRKPDPPGPTDRGSERRDALNSLLAGPEGISLGGMIDLARQASDSAEEAFRRVRGKGPVDRRTDDP